MNATAVSTGKTNKTTMHQEWEAFKDLLLRLVNGILNRVFALTIKGSQQRRVVLMMASLVAIVFFYLAAEGISHWLNYLQVFFGALLTNQPTLKEAVILVARAVLDARLIRLIPVFILPFIFAREFASRYLADIFDLDDDMDDIKIARKFISEVSLGGADNKLTISVDNYYDEKTRESPLLRIGGPGRVTVEMGTAILVERPDGFPRIIDPTHSEEDEQEKSLSDQQKDPTLQKNKREMVKFNPRNLIESKRKKPEIKKDKAILEGFERIREPVDLRVQIPQALEVNARSRDGILIQVIDARVVFSISRGTKTPTLKDPYPFTNEAIYAQVYKRPNRVTENPIEEKSSSSWLLPTVTMKALLRKELGDFMSGHDLGEYLACIGQPEVDAINKIEQDVNTQEQEIVGPGVQSHSTKSLTSIKKSRSELSWLFSDFNMKFGQDQKRRGVEAHWVGVGTWKMPAGVPEKVIPQKHLNAWQATLENLRRGSDQELRELELNAQAEGIQQKILRAPISIYRAEKDPGININRVRIDLITGYWEQLNEAIENRMRAGEPVPPTLAAAYFTLLLTFSHPPYPNIPAPVSTREKKLYGELLKRVKIPQAIEKLIDMERRFAPDASRADLLERIIKAWDKDIQ